MSRFIVAAAARGDLDAIWDYIGIENHNPDAAHRLIETMYEKFSLLALQPLLGQRCEEYEDLVPGLRCFPVGNYLIYYTPTDDGVRIGHVAHAAMDQEAVLRRWIAGGW